MTPAVRALAAPRRSGHGGGGILRDSFGVPHVYAKTEPGMFYGLRRKLRGKDGWLIANGVPERSAVWYEAQSPQFRADLDAFPTGINAYGAAHRDALDPDTCADAGRGSDYPNLVYLGR